MSHFVSSRFGRFWNPARLNETKPVVAVVGDSITQKFNAGSIADSYAGRIRSALQAVYGNGGSGFRGAAESPLIPSVLGSTYPLADRATTTGTWALSSSAAHSFSGPGWTMIATTTAGSSIQWTSMYGSQIDAYILGFAASTGGGTYTVHVDGVLAGTYTTTSKGADAPYRQAVTTAASGSAHTIKVTLVSGGLNLFGVSAEYTAGVVVNTFGRSGLTSANIGSGNNYGAPWNGGAAYPADLLVYALGVNDTSANDSMSSAVGDTARKFVDKVRQSVDCDVLFLSQHVGRFDSNLSYHDTVSRLRELAVAYDGAHVNMWAKYDNTHRNADAVDYWGDTATIGIPGDDDAHPSTIGHGLIFDELNPIINP